MRHLSLALIAFLLSPGFTAVCRADAAASDLTKWGLPIMALGVAAEGLSKDGRHQHTIIKVAEAAGFTAVATDILKALTREERPNHANHNSFPSGHASGAFAVATVMAHDYPKQKWAWYGLAAAIGWSRVALRAHHTHDVIAGALLGIYIGSRVDRAWGPSVHDGVVGVTLLSKKF
jgi:membrane-associated phospholipid phosphatase